MFQSCAGKPCSKPIKVSRQRTSLNVTKTRTSEDISKEGKTKYKIPKNIRYDLETALVSLCDVWFEEIKPYLIRNNIKVHVHENEINKGPDAINCSAMDTRHRNGDIISTKCSHLNPGAVFNHRQQAAVSSVDCCLMRPAALRARSCRPPAPPHPSPRSLQIPPLRFSHVNDVFSVSLPNDKAMKKSAVSKEKKKKFCRNPSLPPHRVARLCRMPNMTTSTLKLPSR